MASLIGPLVAGFVEAPTGQAEVFSRGTSVPSPLVYLDAANLVPTTGPYTLDAHGRVTLYCLESVDVVVRNSTLAQVAAFTWVDAATDVEIQNVEVTGTNANGQSGTGFGYRSTLDAFLTSLRASFGAPDGQVLTVASAVPTNLSTAINLIASAGLLYNVKQAYSAQGDGLTNDLPSIQAAIDAAGVLGGIVIFPPGTYLLQGSLSIPSGKAVRLMAAVPGSVVLKQANAGITTLAISANGAIVDALQFGANGTTSQAVSINATGVNFENCVFDQPTANQIIAMAASAQAQFSDCKFTLNQAAAKLMSLGANARATFNNGQIIISTAGVNSQIASSSATRSYVAFHGTTVSFTPVAGTGSLIGVQAAAPISVAMAGCMLTASVGGTLNVVTSTGAGLDLYESGNSFDPSNGTVQLATPGTTCDLVRGYSSFRDRNAIVFAITSGGAANISSTPDALVLTNEVNVNATVGATQFTWNNPTGFTATPGAQLVLRLVNLAASTQNIIGLAFGTQYISNGAVLNIVPNRSLTWTFVFSANAGKWVQIGAASLSTSV